LDYCNGFHTTSLSRFYDNGLLDCRTIIAAILFVSVLLHELAHSIVALKYGLKIRQIALFIFGGVSDISDEPKDYRREAKMAHLQMTRGVGVGLGGTEEQQSRKKQIGKIFVCDDKGALIGLVSKTDIINIESERQEYVQQVRKFGTP
jgi:Peptidase family M50